MDDFWGVKALIDRHGGIEKFRCFALMDTIDVVLPIGIAAVSSGGNTWVECEVDESRYKIDEGYKITLRPVVPGFAYEDYYQSDFMSLVKSGHIIPKTKENQKIEHVRAMELLCGQAYLIHEGDVVQ